MQVGFALATLRAKGESLRILSPKEYARVNWPKPCATSRLLEALFPK